MLTEPQHPQEAHFVLTGTYFALKRPRISSDCSHWNQQLLENPDQGSQVTAGVWFGELWGCHQAPVRVRGAAEDIKAAGDTGKSE